MATINDIAKAAGVSRATVYRVLRNLPGTKPETEAKVRKVLDETGFKPSTAGQILAVKKHGMRISFIIYENGEENFMTDIRRGAEEKAVELNGFGVQVDFYSFGSQTDISLLFASILETQPDGIITSPLPTDSFHGFMAELNDQKIPVVFYCTDDPNEQRITYVGCDYHKAGRIAAGLASLLMGSAGETALLTWENQPSSEVSSFIGRRAGFTSELKEKYPNISLADGGNVYSFSLNRMDELESWITAHPKLKCVYILNAGETETFQTAVHLLKNKGIYVIMNDLVPSQLELLKEGSLAVTITQQPERMGAESLTRLFEYLAYGQVPPTICNTELTICIEQSV